MEHSHLIVEPNVTSYIYIYIWLGSLWQQYFRNIGGLLKSNYYAKTFKFNNMFPNIKKTRSQIMNHMKYIY